MYAEGFVRKIAHVGDDLMVVNAARVSMGRYKTEFDAADAKLILYLARHGHWTPFAHPQITFHIKFPIFVARQFMRHNVGIVYNEISRRYVDHSVEFLDMKDGSWRSRPEKSIKQGSGPPIGDEQQATATAVYDHLCEMSLRTYNNLLQLGVCPEQARMVLPLGMFTELYATGSLQCFARICKLRQGKTAQKEITDVVNEIDKVLRELYPFSWAALMDPTENKDEQTKHA